MRTEDVARAQGADDDAREIVEGAQDASRWRPPRDLVFGTDLFGVAERPQHVGGSGADGFGDVAELREIEVEAAVERLDDRPQLRLGRHQAAEEPALAALE